MRGLRALVLALPLLSGLAITSPSPGTPAFAPTSRESSGAVQGSDLSAPGWITLVLETRLLRVPVTEPSGSGVGPADDPVGSSKSLMGLQPLGRLPTGPVLSSMEARTGLSSHRATAPPPGFFA